MDFSALEQGQEQGQEQPEAKRVVDESKTHNLGEKILPNVINPHDIETAKNRFLPFKRQIEEANAAASDLVIVNDPMLKVAITRTKEVKVLTKAIETRRKETISDADKYVRGINAFCRAFVEPLKAVEKILKKKIGDFQYQQEMERRKEQQRQAEEARKLQEKMDKEAAEAGIEAPEVKMAPVPETEKVTRTEGGASAHIRKEWKGTIIDDALVPREFCCPDMAKIKAAVKGGIREIPGVEIKEEITTIIR